MFGVMDENPLWYKDAILYELHVRAFFDSNGDGIGDFAGLTRKLDYLQDLGVTALWLLPFYPSPLRDDGYDIADYTAVNPAYGSLPDVRLLVREAHRRGLRVITELVCNHTSDLHPWFQAARRAKPGSALRDFYVWSDTPDKYREARIIFKDFETSNWAWDPVANAYYWHRFYSHQPDLNFDSRLVRQAIHRALDFWLQMGVDGLRLDAVPYLYEREGTNCENLPETHAFLKELRAHIDARFHDRMLLAEANQWPEDSVAYFGNGDECHMAFHFPVMPRLFMAIQMEDRFPILDILAQTPPIPETAQWAMFLRNHDELTLEMVTDEERDYMYRVYARDAQARINLGIRRRLAPLLGNNRRLIELMNILLFSLPGTPVIYYGDEIGMGDNIYLGDRNGVRTPMQWNADRNAGFSEASSQRLYLPVITEAEYHYVAVNVEAQQQNHQSLLWWMKRTIALRKDHPAFGRGSLEFLHPDNRKVLAFIRQHDGEQILVVANLSRFPQYVELDLARWAGCVPVELMGGSEFPRIGDAPYMITLGPNSYYWFALQAQAGPVTIEPRDGAAGEAASAAGDQGTPRTQPEGQPQPSPAAEQDSAALMRRRATARTVAIPNSHPLESLIGADLPEALEAALLAYLRSRPWFAGRGRQVEAVEIRDNLAVLHVPHVRLILVTVRYVGGDAETYQLPMGLATGEQAEVILREQPQVAICRVRFDGRGKEGILYKATPEPAFWQGMLRLLHSRQRVKGTAGTLSGSVTPALRRALSTAGAPVPPIVTREPDPGDGEGQQAAIALYGEGLALKLYRRVEAGTNPELESARFLTAQGFAHVPALAGALEYVHLGERMALGLLQEQSANQGDAWRYTSDVLGHYFERMAASGRPENLPRESYSFSIHSLLAMAADEQPPAAHELLGPYLELCRVLGERTAELHLALSKDAGDSSFAPEPFTSLYQRSVYQSMRGETTQVFMALRRSSNRGRQALPEPVRDSLRDVLELEGQAMEHYRALLGHKIVAARIRSHGHYDLRHVLYTGKDFIILGVEGDESKPQSERRIKRSPLRDVASMLWSFYEVTAGTRMGLTGSGHMRAGDVAALEPWGRFWLIQSGAAFLRAYLDSAGSAPFLPADPADTRLLLDAFLLRQAVEAVGRDLDQRRAWLPVSLRGLQARLGGEE
jgi:maltose alpha-D-glucosyltransferase / alpha-amylase